jgi:Vesicle coat complex, various subunits
MHRAAVALGLVTARLAEKQPEAAKNIIRRLMWHLNEESGNIGWGIPEAFAEILAASEPLAKDFHRILISYVIDLGRDDNYCDNDTLRRSCYWAIGRLAQARPQMCLSARPWLIKGLEDVDMVCRGMARRLTGNPLLPVNIVNRRLSCFRPILIEDFCPYKLCTQTGIRLRYAVRQNMSACVAGWMHQQQPMFCSALALLQISFTLVSPRPLSM